MGAGEAVGGGGRRRWRTGLLLLGLAGGAALALPDARVLWWLHFRAAAPARYVVPVAGVQTIDLEPNYGGPRALGPHEGIDILSPMGTPVLAAADGLIVDDRPTGNGGNVLWV